MEKLKGKFTTILNKIIMDKNITGNEFRILFCKTIFQEVRTSLSMTQKSFANILGVSCRTVEAWECGKSTPTPTAKKLIYLIQQDHSLVDKLN